MVHKGFVTVNDAMFGHQVEIAGPVLQPLFGAVEVAEGAARVFATADPEVVAIGGAGAGEPEPATPDARVGERAEDCCRLGVEGPCRGERVVPDRRGCGCRPRWGQAGAA